MPFAAEYRQSPTKRTNQRVSSDSGPADTLTVRGLFALTAKFVDQTVESQSMPSELLHASASSSVIERCKCLLPSIAHEIES